MREVFPHMWACECCMFIMGTPYMETIKPVVESVLGQLSIRKNICNGFKHIEILQVMSSK